MTVNSSVALESKRVILSNRGNLSFTLIELLVVLSIISLLMAILLPALIKARTISKRIACQSNLKQIALAWHMYLDDNDESFYQGINANVLYGGWEGIVYPNEPRPLNRYLSLSGIPKSEAGAKVFRCPADKGGLKVTALPIYSYLGTSYQTNIFLIGQNQIGWLPSSELRDAINIRLKNLIRGHVGNPSRLLLIGDYGWMNQSLPLVPRMGDWHGRPYHHNLAFLDGHVGFLHIRKGLYVTDEYTVLPFKDLYRLAREVQEEEPPR